MAPDNGSNNLNESYEHAPDNSVDAKAIIERGMDLTEDKARLERVQPLDSEAIQAIDVQLQSAEDDYVRLMKLERGRIRNESVFRRRFRNKINRQARQSLRYDMNHDIDMDLIDVNLNINGGPGSLESPAERQQASANIERSYSFGDVQTDSRERREVIKSDLDIEDYVSNKNALIIIAQKFRESKPPLLASSLKSKDDAAYAIKTAFYPFPAEAEKMIADIREGGAAGDAAKELVHELAKNLEPHMAHSIEREQLAVEMGRDDLIEETGNRLGKVLDEFRRHPVPALIGSAALIGALTLAWKHGPDWMKTSLKYGGMAIGGSIGVGMLANMVVRSQSDDGSDLWDWLGFKPEDMGSDPSRLDKMQSQFPDLNLENDQAGRDLMIMMDADTDNVYDVFKAAFNKGEESININALSARDTDVDNDEANSMNGKASYSALKGYFILLAEKTAKANGTSQRGMSERQKVEEGLQIFRNRFVGRPEDLNLQSAILMTIDQADVRAAGSAMGPGSGLDMGGSELLSETERAAQKRIEAGLALHGIEADVDYVGHHDGAEWVLIDGFPWQYTYDSDRELHTFTDTVSGTVNNIGKTVDDSIDKNSQELARRRVNDYYPGVPELASVEWNADKNEWITTNEITSPAIPYLNLAERKSHFGLNFDPRKGLKPYVYVSGSENTEGSPNFEKVREAYDSDRIEDAVGDRLEPLLGDLGVNIEVTDYDNIDAIANPDEGRVQFKWGPSLEFEGQIMFIKGEISTAPGEFVLIQGVNGPAPDLIVEQWENAGDVMAELLVENNPQYENALAGLAAAFAGKDGTPRFSLSDMWTFLESEANFQNENDVWAEAIQFQQGALHAEVKRAVVQAYRDDPIGMMDSTTRDAKMDQIKDSIVAPRVAAMNQRASEIAASNNDGGQLSAVKTAEALKLRQLGMDPDYARWLGKFEGVMKDKAGLDTVGMEGQERARLIHDAILLTIIEYSSPMHQVAGGSFHTPEAKKWRDYLDKKFPIIISRAIHEQDGNWWIDQRYNATGFERIMGEIDPPIRPWRSMEDDLSDFVGSTSGTLNIPFYTPEYTGGSNEIIGGGLSLTAIPTVGENETDLDYRIRLSQHIGASTRAMIEGIDEFEYSFRPDEYDNFLNWRVSRSIQEFNENSISGPRSKAASTQLKLAQDMIRGLKEESLKYSAYQPYLTPEGGLDRINPWNELDISTLTEVEYIMVQGMIQTSPEKTKWDQESKEVLFWLNSAYHNTDVMGLNVPWVRTDVMRLWMEKIGHGKPMSNEEVPYDSSEIGEYRKFFTNVAEDLLPNDQGSLADLSGRFSRSGVQAWKNAQGSLEMIPSFEEWQALGSPSRAEVDVLDWKEKEEIREHDNVRAQVDTFMNKFDSDVNVAKLTRLDGRWPELFRSHVLERLESDVMAKATDPITGRVDPEKLQDELRNFETFVQKETVFYNYIIESRVSANDGTGEQNLSTAALMGAGLLTGAITGGVLGIAGGTSSAGPGVGTAIGAAGGALGGGALGGATGWAAGQLLEATGLPQIGVQTGEQMHSRVKAIIDTQWDAQYVNGGPSMNPNTYYTALEAALEQDIKNAIAYDASGLDLGPIRIYMPGGNMDRLQVSP